jgi:hypothetical protein
MKNKPPLTNEHIEIIYKCLSENILMKNFKSLSLSDWESMLFAQDNLTHEDFLMLLSTAKDCLPLWHRLNNPRKGSHELLLRFDSAHRDIIEPITYEVNENKIDHEVIFKIPDYLIDEEFKKYSTKIVFGSLPIETMNRVNDIFGDFISLNNGVMSYLKLNIKNMCIYLHKYVMVTDTEVKYVHKYILDSFTRFDAHQMSIYITNQNYNFINELNNLITNEYTNEMFDKLFTNLTDDELTVLKMRVI